VVCGVVCRLLIDDHFRKVLESGHRNVMTVFERTVWQLRWRIAAVKLRRTTIIWSEGVDDTSL